MHLSLPSTNLGSHSHYIPLYSLLIPPFLKHVNIDLVLGEDQRFTGIVESNP